MNPILQQIHIRYQILYQHPLIQPQIPLIRMPNRLMKTHQKRSRVLDQPHNLVKLLPYELIVSYHPEHRPEQLAQNFGERFLCVALLHHVQTCVLDPYGLLLGDEVRSFDRELDDEVGSACSGGHTDASFGNLNDLKHGVLEGLLVKEVFAELKDVGKRAVLGGFDSEVVEGRVVLEHLFKLAPLLGLKLGQAFEELYYDLL